MTTMVPVVENHQQLPKTPYSYQCPTTATVLSSTKSGIYRKSPAPPAKRKTTALSTRYPRTKGMMNQPPPSYSAATATSSSSTRQQTRTLAPIMATRKRDVVEEDDGLTYFGCLMDTKTIRVAGMQLNSVPTHDGKNLVLLPEPHDTVLLDSSVEEEEETALIGSSNKTRQRFSIVTGTDDPHNESSITIVRTQTDRQYVEAKKRNHKEVERNRRDKINHMIGEIERILPPIEADQGRGKNSVSKGEILGRAVQLFRSLTKTNDALLSTLYRVEAQRKQGAADLEKSRGENHLLRQFLADKGFDAVVMDTDEAAEFQQAQQGQQYYHQDNPDDNRHNNNIRASSSSTANQQRQQQFVSLGNAQVTSEVDNTKKRKIQLELDYLPTSEVQNQSI